MAISSGGSRTSVARRVLGTLENLLLKYRTLAALAAAYVSLHAKLWEGAVRPPGPAQTQLPGSAAGPDLSDLGAVEPLTRTAALARARSCTATRQPLLLRRDAAARGPRGGREALGTETEEDAVDLLERSVKLVEARNGTAAGAITNPHLANVYRALGNMYSARARYTEALRAMDLAAHAAADGGDGQDVALGHAALGQLELKHYRFASAEARFGDALQVAPPLVTSGRAAALLGAGWAALMQGGSSTADGRFLAALQLVGPSGSGDPAIAALDNCEGHHDGLDSFRGFALAGLSLSLSRSAAGSGVQGTRPHDLCECSAQVLLHAGAAGPDGPHDELRALHALGVARLALGQVESARRQHRRAWRLAQRLAPTALPGNDLAGFCGTSDLPLCAHSALHLGLVELAAGDAALGARYVDRLIASAAAAAPEAAEWVTRFARAHAWLPGGEGFAELLTDRAATLLSAAGGGGVGG